MPQEMRLWKVLDGSLHPISQGSLDLESRLEQWLQADISMLGMELLVIGQQVRTDFGGYIDLLCINPDGDLVIVELKRDRTPRDITAQLLDYASWLVDLSADSVSEIADEWLGSDGPLPAAFRRAFGEELPDVINESHQLIVVGSNIDPASERIIRYLSDHHGISMNAVTFQYFRSGEGAEFIGRVFLIEPDTVSQQVQRKGSSKRRPTLSLEELQEVADTNGVGELYRQAFERLGSLFNYHQTTRSSLRLAASFEDRTGAVLNLIPTREDVAGLAFQIFTHRAAKYFGCSAASIVEVLPAGTELWEYWSGQGDWWRGHAGEFRSVDEVRVLAAHLAQALPTGSDSS